MKIYINGKRQVPKKGGATNRTRKGRFAWKRGGLKLAIGFGIAFLLALAIWWFDEPIIVSPLPEEPKYVSPIPETKAKPAIQLAVVPVGRQEEREDDNHSFYVEVYAQKYARNDYERYRLVYLLHCLLWNESNHYLNKAHGDNGKAGGPLQYHDGTWVAFRKEMMRQGLVKEIGSRYDLKDAIETTAWALVNGRQNHWGPIARGECK